MTAVAFRILERALIRLHGAGAPITNILNNSRKERVSIVLYLFSIPIAFFHIAPSIACCVIVAVIRFIPSKELEKAVEKQTGAAPSQPGRSTAPPVRRGAAASPLKNNP